MLKTASLLFALMFITISASADGVAYTVTVDTSSIAGTAGSLDFQFNPGGMVTQAANLQILSFASDGSLSSPTLTGDVTGALPGTVSFDNGTGYNDYFAGFTYGDTLSFELNLLGPAIISPDGTSTSGSAFAFSMFSDSGGTIPALTTDTTDGYALTANVNSDGTVTLTNYSSQLTPGPISTPEPGTLLLLASGLSGLVVLRMRSWRAGAHR